MRWRVFRLGDDHFRCVWTIHHLLADGRSALLILREVFAALRCVLERKRTAVAYAAIVSRTYRLARPPGSQVGGVLLAESAATVSRRQPRSSSIVRPASDIRRLTD